MQAVIVATEQNRDLEPIVDEGCIALLPVVGKPVIEYTIESLRQAGFRDAVVITHGKADQLVSSIGNGCRWGMRILYQDTSQEPDGVPFLSSSHETLVVRGDTFWNLDLEQFLEQARCSGKQQVIATHLNQPVAKWLKGGVMSNSIYHVDSELHSSLCINQILKTYCFSVSDYMRYFRINLALINGQLAPRLPNGREMIDGLYLDVGAQIQESCVESSSAAYIGRNSHVHKTAALSGIVVVDKDVVIDRRVTLENCVVLPGTYIGEMMCVKDSIVCGNTYVNIYTGLVTTIDDAVLVAAL